VNLLLDTHVLLWWLSDDTRLHRRSRAAISAGTVIVSVASVWEIAIKQALGKLRLPDTWIQHLRLQDFSVMSIETDHAIMAGALPQLHGDPFDRMLVAQASIESLTIVTADPQIRRYGVSTLSAT